MLPSDGVAWTSAVVATFERMGVAEKAARQALLRSRDAGWLIPERDGRRTRWGLTPTARRLLTEGAQRIYSFGPARDWDGRWVLVTARVPDGDRHARHVLRTRLNWAGFGQLGTGVWASPHPSREREAITVLGDLGLTTEAHVFLARRVGPTDARTMVRQAWDLPAIDAEYQRFTGEFRPPVPRDVMVRQLELVHAWRRFPSIDPALPAELLPPRWAGIEAAQLFTERHAQWTGDTRREWTRLNKVA